MLVEMLLDIARVEDRVRVALFLSAEEYAEQDQMTYDEYGISFAQGAWTNPRAFLMHLFALHDSHEEGGSHEVELEGGTRARSEELGHAVVHALHAEPIDAANDAMDFVCLRIPKARDIGPPERFASLADMFTAAIAVAQVAFNFSVERPEAQT